MKLQTIVGWGIGLFLGFSECKAADIPEPVARSPIEITLGEQRLLAVPGLLRYSVGNKNVHVLDLPTHRKAKFPSDQLLLKGAAVGHTDLWVWTRDGQSAFRNIEVTKARKREGSVIFPSALLQGLEGLQEIEILNSGSAFTLRGRIQSFAEARRVNTLVENFPTLVSDETHLADELVNEGRRKLEAALTQIGNPYQLRVEGADGQVTVGGTFPNPSDRRRAERRLREVFPKFTTQFYALPDSDPTIYVRVCLLELHKKQFQHLGLSWPASQEGAFRVLRSGIQTHLQLDVALQMMEGEGTARILSNPELVLRIPGEAELFAGGELPIKTNSQNSSQLQWKSFGLSLKLKTTHFAGKKLRLEILSEVSQLDSEIALDSVPGIQANRLKTMVDAEFGKPLFLSGLIQRGFRRQAKGFPVLKDIPILGRLFSSEDYLEQNSELVAILIPELETPIARRKLSDSLAEFPPLVWEPETPANSLTTPPTPSFARFPFAFGRL